MGGTVAGAGLGLGPEAFLHLLVTELRHQDPLRPMEDREFLAQLAQLAQVERLARVEEQLGRVVEAVESGRQPEAILAGAALIGRTVLLAGGEQRTVVGAGPGGGGIELVLDDGRRVGLADVQAVLGSGRP